jgi:hypothetical protein
MEKYLKENHLNFLFTILRDARHFAFSIGKSTMFEISIRTQAT